MAADSTAGSAAGPQSLSCLLAAPSVAGHLAASQDAWRPEVVAWATTSGCRCPASPSPWRVTRCMRSASVRPLVKGLCDFFGAHTHARVDREGTFHTEWSGDRSERAL